MIVFSPTRFSLFRVLVAAGICVSSTGCAPFVVAKAGYFGVGSFKIDDRAVTEDVRYTSVKGVGVLGGREGLSVGYVESARVVANVKGKSYRVATPLVDFAVGEEAERDGFGFLSGTDAD